jgi:hypothetical protein
MVSVIPTGSAGLPSSLISSLSSAAALTVPDTAGGLPEHSLICQIHEPDEVSVTVYRSW